jgi:hypothetical protein
VLALSITIIQLTPEGPMFTNPFEGESCWNWARMAAVITWNYYGMKRMNAVPDSATGETVGNTSLFRSNQSIANLLPLQGKITAIQIGSKNYVQTAFSFSKNSQP